MHVHSSTNQSPFIFFLGRQRYCSTILSGHLSIGDRWCISSLEIDQQLTISRIARINRHSIRTVYRIIELSQEANDAIERTS